LPTGYFKNQYWRDALFLACFLSAIGFLSITVMVPRVWAKPAGLDPSGWFVDMNRFSDSAHGAIKCEECHGSMAQKGQNHPDPASKDFLKRDSRRSFDYQSCAKCHKLSHDRYLIGDHAEARKKELETGNGSMTGYAPVCGDCHLAHYAKSHLSRIEIGKQMTETCGTCHPAQKSSYLANYHGKTAVNLGYDKSASCTDCHGGHTVISLKDPVAALTACRRCHPDATPQFADIIIHDSLVDMDKKSEAKQTGLRFVHTLSLLSLVFIVGVLAFFYSHSCLLMLRKIHEKLRKHN
jgi:hypothetical protein